MKNRILFVLRLLTGLMFINAGLNKFFHYMPVPKDLPEKAVKAGMTFMEIGWLMPLVGTAEIVGGILFILPKTRALGAIILLPVLTGVLLCQYLYDALCIARGICHDSRDCLDYP